MFNYLPNLTVIFFLPFVVTLHFNGATVNAEDLTDDEVSESHEEAIPDEGSPIDELHDDGNLPDDDADPPVDEGAADDAQDDDSTVETEEEASEGGDETATTGKDSATDEEEETSSGIGPSAEAETTVLFPDYPDKQLPAGKLIRVLVGITNRGEKDFIISSIDASFRYPQDFSYHIQNFTATYYSSVVVAGQENTFQYQFYPHESYGGRPFGLAVMMLYKDNEGGEYAAGVFNETVTFKELDDAFDGEQFFLYIFLAAISLLVVFAINYAFTSAKGKRSFTQPRAEEFEQGTQKGDIDYDWLPSQTMSDFNKASPRRSPRQRKNQNKQAAGSGVESD